jgi:hypothetical protein
MGRQPELANLSLGLHTRTSNTMKIHRRVWVTASFVCILAFAPLNHSPAAGGDTTTPAAAAPPKEDPAALELGRKVLAVQRALEQPQAPESLEAVKALGLDSRYHVMVRGWLSQQLRNDQSIRDASKERTPQKIRDRIAFVEKAIRAIDLEH